MISGRATAEGTRRFAERSDAAEGHFREAPGGLSLSSIGLGTYLGADSASADAGYEASVREALVSAINVLDTAINYRGQKSERAVGRALAAAFASGAASRDEVFVSTKGGYLPHDADVNVPGLRYTRETFVDTGLAPADEIAQGCHCMAPSYLRDQIARSRANLGLETIDLYYLHNVETQLGAVGRDEFTARLRRAVEALEEAADGGAIAAWGLATWDGLRVPPEHPEHLSLEAVRAIAEEVGGEGHRFRGVQLPVNMAMAQAVAFRSQAVGGRRLPALAAARALGLATFGSASILQGRLSDGLPPEVVEAFPGLETDAQRALQFSRSAPGETCALVGASRPEHAREDFAVARVPPASEDAVMGLFR
ncbi:MAG TPA: aldo/keto reductase [Thermoanaerobaculia bacterium]|nr:aldo/keto reductase [Thermoanaerobaculia bacterium]